MSGPDAGRPAGEAGDGAGGAAGGLELCGVRLRRGGRTVLDGCELVVPPGALAHLAGGNGAGKTSLLRVAAGLLRPQSGIVRRPRGGTAWVPDLGTTTSRLRVDELCRVWLAGSPDGSGARLAALLDRVGLAVPPRARPGELSRGERQRLLVAVAVASGRPLVLADEPLAGVDAQRRPVLLELLAGAAREGRSVLLTGHLRDDVPPGGRRLRLAHGRVAAVEPARTSVVVDAVRRGMPERHEVGPDEVPALLRVLLDAGVEITRLDRA